MRLVVYRYHDPGVASDQRAMADLLESLRAGLARQGIAPMTNVRIYEDWAIATNPSHRPQLAQLLADSRSAPADPIDVDSVDSMDHVWVGGLAELGDSPAAVQRCLDHLAQAGATVWIGHDPNHLTPVAALGESIALATAMQNQQAQRQKRAGHARNRLQALPPPGKAPYGYRRGQERYLIDRTAAPVITAFVNEFLIYGSLRGAVRFVEKRFGKRISVSTGRRWLTHPVYRGDLQYRDGQVMGNTHAAIITRDEAAQVDRLLRRNRPLPPRTAGAPRSLAGLVHCQTCGGSMAISTTTVRGKAQRYVYLRPTACPQRPRCPALPYDAVLQAVIADICHTLPQAVAQWQIHRATPVAGPAPTDLLHHQLQQRETVLAQLPHLVETGILDPETADLRRYNLRAEMAQIAQHIAQCSPVNLAELAPSVALPQFWLDLSESERRFFFREFIRRIDLIRQGETWRVALVLVFQTAADSYGPPR